MNIILKPIDAFLNTITTYRLVLYFLIILVVLAAIFGLLGWMPYQPIDIAFSTLFLVVGCWIANKVFAWAYDAPTNVESVYITALILVLIITPAKSFDELAFLFWAAAWAMGSKYILAINRKHIFNPAAIAVVITAFFIGQSASWWISASAMMPVILIGGLLIMRKMQDEDMLFYFFAAAAITIVIFALLKGSDPMNTLVQLFGHSSLLFFAFIMLTEPLTAPTTKELQMVYAILVGILFAPGLHIGGIFSTPELALVIGNLFAYLVSPKQKLFLTLKQKVQVSPDVIDFVFATGKKLNFIPGQYMEWTLPHAHADSRGNRRYLTIASSPTEDDVRLGVKFYPNGSSYKQALATIDDKKMIVGAQLAGNFTLPKDPTQKCVFIAGGIGITPFRSMIKYLVDTNQPRPITLVYTNTLPQQIIYTDVFSEAQHKLGIKTVYTITDPNSVPENWQGYNRRIDADMLAAEVPDYKDSHFYISGSQRLVDGARELLLQMGIPRHQIVTDFFPGLA